MKDSGYYALLHANGMPFAEVLERYKEDLLAERAPVYMQPPVKPQDTGENPQTLTVTSLTGR